MKKKQNVTGNDTKSKKESKVKMALPLCHTKGLPYYSDIKMSWKVNQRHCDPNAPEKREHYIDRGIKFSDEWLNALGWLRYYLFCIDNGYEKGKSKLIRIDDNKGFMPSNCRVIDKIVKEKKAVSSKPKTPKTQPSTDIKRDSTTPANINNHFMIFTSDSMKSQDIIELLKSVGNQPIDDEHNRIIYLDTAESQSIKQKNIKN
jgi:hypothetical protein